MSHVHRPDPSRTVTRPFAGPVSKYENRAAHGNVCEVFTCKCGATRLVNINGNHIERGDWTEPEPEAHAVARLRLVRREVPR